MWGAERKDDKLFRCKKKKKKGNADVEQREGEFLSLSTRLCN